MRTLVVCPLDGNEIVLQQLEFAFFVRGFGCALFILGDGGVKEYGYVRPIDKLGRFVIPHDLRKQYDIDGKDVLIIPQQNGILLKPYNKKTNESGENRE